jgi:hypothetical protein
MHKADAHPVHHQACCALADFAEPEAQATLVGAAGARSGKSRAIVKSTRRCNKRCSPRAASSSKWPKRVNEGATRQTTAPWFGHRMSVIEHVAHDRFAGADQAQRARRRHPEVMHGLAAQELADRRAQYGASICATRIRRRAGTLELQFKALLAAVDDFAEQDRPSITELPGPLSELVAAIATGVADHARQQAIAGQRGDHFRCLTWRPRRDRALPPLRASRREGGGVATGVGSTSDQQAPKTCRGSLRRSGSPGNSRRKRLSNCSTGGPAYRGLSGGERAGGPARDARRGRQERAIASQPLRTSSTICAASSDRALACISGR